MNTVVAQCMIIPFLGTALGAACVLFMKNTLNPRVQRALTGFAAGVMVAASIWSLLIPAMEQAESMGSFAFVPAVVGFCLGMLFLLLLDKITPHMHLDQTTEGPASRLRKTTMLVLAVVIHNIPEGMAIGVVCVSFAFGGSGITASAALALAIGIAIQNFPEGAIISMPLAAKGLRRSRAFFCGVLSGLVEPIAGALTVLLSGLLVPVLPYLLSFAAGAMQYVVLAELVPEITAHGKVGLPLFAAGFVVMMALDVSFG